MAQKDRLGRGRPIASVDEGLYLIAQILLIGLRLTVDRIRRCSAWSVRCRRVITLAADTAVLALSIGQADENELFDLGTFNIQASP